MKHYSNLAERAEAAREIMRAEARRQIQQLHRKWISQGNAAGAFLEACAEYCNETDFRMDDERDR